MRGDNYPRLPATLVRCVPASSWSSRAAAAPDGVCAFPCRLLRAPDQYLNLRMRALTEKGRAAEGQFAGINADGRIVIRRELSGPGEASYILRPTEVTQIELLEP
jgi:hypothetical protein